MLLRSQRYEGVYYLSGYVVECALKACIAKLTRRHDFPDKETVNRSYRHNLSDLVGVAGLELELRRQMKADRLFEVNWSVVKDWSEQSRYQRPTGEEARDLYSAVAHRQHGVLQWLRRHW